MPEAEFAKPGFKSFRLARTAPQLINTNLNQSTRLFPAGKYRVLAIICRPIATDISDYFINLLIDLSIPPSQIRDK